MSSTDRSRLVKHGGRAVCGRSRSRVALANCYLLHRHPKDGGAECQHARTRALIAPGAELAHDGLPAIALRLRVRPAPPCVAALRVLCLFRLLGFERRWRGYKGTSSQ